MKNDIEAAGAQAARDGARRSSNPHKVDSDDWVYWMDGFDQETIHLERGTSHPTSDRNSRSR